MIFKVQEIKCLHANCWGAKCMCGQWLTKHDWDAEEARKCAEHEISRTDGRQHECEYTRQMSLV